MADPGWSFIQKFVIVGHVGVGKVRSALLLEIRAEVVQTSVLNRVRPLARPLAYLDAAQLTDKAFDPESVRLLLQRAVPLLTAQNRKRPSVWLALRIVASSDCQQGVDYGSRIVELENGKRTKLQIWDSAFAPSLGTRKFDASAAGGSEAFRSITRR